MLLMIICNAIFPKAIQIYVFNIFIISLLFSVFADCIMSQNKYKKNKLKTTFFIYTKQQGYSITFKQ